MGRLMSSLDFAKVLNCRCGGSASEPQKVERCSDRWIVECAVERCEAKNIGQGKQETINGWNRLCEHSYR